MINKWDKKKKQANKQRITNRGRSWRGLLGLTIILSLAGCGNLYKIEPEIENLSIDSKDKPEKQAAETNQPAKEAATDKKEAADSADSKADKKEGADQKTEGSVGDGVEKKEAEKKEAEAEPKQDSAQTTDPTVLAKFVNQFSKEKPFDKQVALDSLDTTEYSWSFKRNQQHQPVTAYNVIDIGIYGGYYLGNTEEKVVYLTFDEGYENGFSPSILDTLKNNQVKATFFITGQYLRSEPDLVKRMAAEGHIVGNHSFKHPNFAEISDDRIYEELTEVANRYQELTGQEMAPFFRPPMGKYNERVLYLVRKLGYRTIFWSMAHRDWETDNQPGKEAAYQHVMDNYHNGAIILLHAVSQSNTEALDDMIKQLLAEGYRFGSLYELE